MEPRARDVEKIKAAIDQALGEETSDLVFKTLKLVYRIDEEQVILHPELFEEKIRKMLGEHAAELILKAIRENS